MADINATDLTAETLATLDGSENVVLFDTAEGKKVTLQVLADYIITKAVESLMGSNQTVAAALSALNSKVSVFSHSISTTSNTSITITAGSDRQCFVVFGGINHPSKALFTIINIDSRQNEPCIKNLGDYSASATFGQSKQIVTLSLLNWSNYCILSDFEFSLSFT